MALRILFAPYGSQGDVNPLLWLADGLAARGHVCEFVVSPYFAPLMARHGFKWFPCGTAEEYVRFARDPRLWLPGKGSELVLESLALSFENFRAGFALAGNDYDLVVTSSLAAGAMALAESRGWPRLVLHFQPVMTRSIYDDALYLENARWLAALPSWMKWLTFRLVDRVYWDKVKVPFNRFRRELGLSPLAGGMFHYLLAGAQGNAALFPEWFSPRRADWPQNLRQFGFPLVQAKAEPLMAKLENFLANGEAPLLWTHGSANFDVALFQRVALEVSRKLGRRCLLVGGDTPQQKLTANELHVPYARFDDLMPRCAAVVHHGGIGTTAQALMAGVPQLIVPRAHDQPDNGNRVARLGVGRMLSYRRLGVESAAEALMAMLGDEGMRSRCADCAEWLRGSSSLASLCDWAEELAKKYP